MRNTEKVHRSAAPNLLVQYPLAELTLQLAVDPSKSRRSIPAKADGRSQQEPTVDPSKSRRSIPARADGKRPTVDPDIIKSHYDITISRINLNMCYNLPGIPVSVCIMLYWINKHT
jgi:hypothetical protein